MDHDSKAIHCLFIFFRKLIHCLFMNPCDDEPSDDHE
jgi:hypothetical protein